MEEFLVIPLSREMRQVLARLELVSNGRIYSYEPVGSKGGFAGSEPKSGDAFPPHVFWLRRWTDAEPHEQAAVLKGAEDEYASLVKRTLPADFEEKPEPPVERSARLLRDGEGIPLKEAAFRLGCAPSELRRLRVGGGRDAQSGRVVARLPDSGPERARALFESGVSTREIAVRLGKRQTQVMRWLRVSKDAA